MGSGGHDALRRDRAGEFLRHRRGGPSGAFGTVTFTGSGSDEQFIGTALADLLMGENGDDRLDGGFGVTVSTGGVGADVFVFASRAGEVLTITDFEIIQGDRVEPIRENPADSDGWIIADAGGGTASVTFSAGKMILFEGHTAAEIDASWFA